MLRLSIDRSGPLPEDDDNSLNGLELGRLQALGKLDAEQVQEGEFEYDSLNKPDFIPAAMFFRSIMMFKSMDLANKGLATYHAVMGRVGEVLKRDLKGEKMPDLIQEIALEKERTKREYIHFSQFLAILIKVQVRYLNSETNKQIGIRRHSGGKNFNEFGLGAKDEQLEKWNSKNVFGRRWFDLMTYVKRKQNKKFIFVGKRGFKKIEARYGDSLAAYFEFTQGLLIMNFFSALIFLLLLVPGIMHFSATDIDDFSGLIIGLGFERTWFFYGGYPPSYENNYRIDLLWLLCPTLMLLIGLYKALVNVDARNVISAGNEENETAFSAALFAMWDHKISSRTNIKLQRYRLGKTLENMLGEKREFARVQLDRNMKNRVLRLLGSLFSFIYAGITAALIGFLLVNEQEMILRVQSNPLLANFATLVVPTVVSGFKAASPSVMQFIVTLEPHARSADRFRVMFLRIFIVKMFYLLVVLFQSGSLTETQKGLGCKETQIGITYYKILWIEHIFEIGLSVIMPWFLLRTKNRCLQKFTNEKSFSEEEYEDGIKDMRDKDKIKDEFAVAKELIDVMYVQALIWAGAPFSPMIPFLGFFFGVIMIFVKQTQVLFFSRPPLKPLGVASQNRYFRSMMVITLIISVIPFSLFLRRTVTCGPHVNHSPISVFFAWVDALPSAISFVITLSQSAALLWTAVLLMILYIAFLAKKESLLAEDLASIRRRVKTEVKEKHAIIRENGIMLDRNKDLGKNMFKSWIESLGDFGVKYCRLFQACYLDDLLELASLEKGEIRSLMEGWRDPSFTVPDSHIEFCQAELEREQVKLVRK